MDWEAAEPPGGLLQCKECTILIGPGYQETRPIQAPDGRGVLCWRCYESYLRQQERKARARAGGV